MWWIDSPLKLNYFPSLHAQIHLNICECVCMCMLVFSISKASYRCMGNRAHKTSNQTTCVSFSGKFFVQMEHRIKKQKIWIRNCYQRVWLWATIVDEYRSLSWPSQQGEKNEEICFNCIFYCHILPLFRLHLLHWVLNNFEVFAPLIGFDETASKETFTMLGLTN